MTKAMSLPVIVSIAFVTLGTSAPVQAQQTPMTFFVTSVGLNKGGDLGGLAGADRHCQSLAQAAGAGSKTWHAYLSTQGSGGVNAKDRIGNGPWSNAKGVQIASNVADLHGDNNKINKETALNEKGAVVNGRVDTPNKHDILTGTQRDGTAVPGPDDATCSNWTSSADGQGNAVVGHHDLIGNPQGINFWNYSHKTPGCAPANLQKVGGAGLALLLCDQLGRAENWFSRKITVKSCDCRRPSAAALGAVGGGTSDLRARSVA